MQKSQSNTPVPCGEQRSSFHNCHYTVFDAARLVGVPDTWIWAWLFSGKLKSKKRAKCIWVRLGDVRTLFRNERAVDEAYMATHEPLSDPEAVRQVVDRWPDIGVCMYYTPPESGTFFCLEDDGICQ